ncbi:hypothetical protein M3Y95_00410300 [Aphelenchoides besseyi]|nr:hypothetical protein M3Y95_00410300 [Aphelenchoides besseyi]
MTKIKCFERVELTTFNDLRSFAVDELSTYSQTSGTLSYASFWPVKMHRFRDLVLCQQDENDCSQKIEEKFLIVEGDRPEVLCVDEKALERVNLWREKRNFVGSPKEIRIEVAQNEGECDLMCKLISESLNLALEKSTNVHGKSIQIRIENTMENPQHRTFQLTSGSEKLSEKKNDVHLDKQALKHVEETRPLQPESDAKVVIPTSNPQTEPLSSPATRSTPLLSNQSIPKLVPVPSQVLKPVVLEPKVTAKRELLTSPTQTEEELEMVSKSEKTKSRSSRRRQSKCSQFTAFFFSLIFAPCRLLRFVVPMVRHRLRLVAAPIRSIAEIV